MAARADLHVHSKHSNRPSDWILRRSGAPESFTEPADLYRLCRERGMDFVTVSDHDSIAGALEVAHLPGTFLSSEMTVAFPEDGCQIHCLVAGIGEGEFRELDRLRGNVYEFRDYLYDHDLVYSVAHPLFQVNDALTLEHLEKLLVLFKRFEGINGSRDPRAAALARAVLGNLKPRQMARLAERHGIDPRDPQPWVKHLTAGSDDHSGLYVAAAYTETPEARSVEEFLEHLRRGRHRVAGESGSSLKLARAFLSIGRRFYQERTHDRSARRDPFLEVVGEIVAGGSLPDLGPRGRVRFAAGRLLQLSRRGNGNGRFPGAGELARLAAAADEDPSATVERRCFQLAARLSQELASTTLREGSEHLARGDLARGLRALAGLEPAAIAAAPYLAAFLTQHKDEDLLQAVAGHFPAAAPLREKSRARAWFTDSPEGDRRATRLLRAVASDSRRRGRELVVITSREEVAADGLPVRNFPPLAQFPLPVVEGVLLAFPPFLEIFEYCERRCFAEVVVGTPGPMGLVGLATARLLGLKVSGIYPTDFPLHARQATGSKHFEDLAWGVVRWFYQQMDVVYAPNRPLLERLVERGFDHQRLRLLPAAETAYEVLWAEADDGVQSPFAAPPPPEPAPVPSLAGP